MTPADFRLLQFIPLFPLAGATLNLAVGKRFGRTFAALCGCGAVLAAMVLSWWAFIVLARAPEGGGEAITGALFSGDWIHASDVAGASISIRAGLLFDHLSGILCLVITSVGFLIHLYSTAYMEHDEGFSRYFGYLNLFTGAMLILVLGDSLPVTFVGWEGVGLCSYLLIGFWFTKEANASAGKKAFIVNRVGDFGFLLGMFMLFCATSTLNYAELSSPAAIAGLRHVLLGHAPGPVLTYATVGALLLFVGATGKSAQLPLYIWLPDAMAGPTPVSALIHAATMVTAGVYMIARLHVVFALDPFVSAVIAVVGAVTALYAATMGVTARAIKKILAYSTISQLGFMFIGVGTTAYTAGVFHLVTHAFFKAGLFLGAGSIMHALGGEEDVFKMGGLRKKLPITHLTFLVYCLAIAGIFPFAGFFSKDAILAGAFEFGSQYAQMVPQWPQWLGHFIYALGLAAAACTAFYMFRAYFLVFHGEFRGEHHVLEHAHESPPAMSIPLIVLAALSAGAGFLGVPEVMHKDWDRFGEWLSPSVFAPEVSHLAASTEWALMGVATAISLLGIALAYAMYGRGVSSLATSLAGSLSPLHKLVSHKYYVDEIYDFLVVRPLRSISFYLWKVVDAFLIDLVLVRGAAVTVDLFGRTTRYLQNGEVQRSVVGVLVGATGLVVIGTNYAAWHASGFDTEVSSGGTVTVRAHGDESARPAGEELLYSFDFGDDSQPVVNQRGAVAEHHYDKPGRHKIRVEVRDPRWNAVSRDSQSVLIGEGSAPRADATPVHSASDEARR